MKKTAAPKANRLQSPRHYRALRELLTGPRSVRQLFEITGSNGIPQLISGLKTKSLEIDTIEQIGFDRDGRKVYFCVYQIRDESRKRAHELIEAYEQQRGHG